jgi:lipopolysaccharide assembly outer membrane protein LptD (OstA)
LYDKQGKELLRHRLTQPIDLTRGKLRPLTNEIGITLFDQSISNETSYSHKLGIVTSTATTVSGDTGIFDYSLRHLYKYSTDDGVTDRYIQGNVNFNINANHSLKFSYERDLLEESTRGYEIAHTYRKSCWETQLSFTREIAPYNVSGGTSASRDSDIIFLRLTLVPFGNISQQLYASERTRR